VLIKSKLVLLLIFCCCRQAISQTFSPPSYPKDYFRNPVGLPMEIVANMGELRTTHWHMGLDIRTNQKENQPIYAAAEGYIAHIGIRPLSFGRFIIINHPNGLSTLYGHLNDFAPELEKYVTEQQYKNESWAIEIDFTEKQFPVHKSELIAYSGNTGGSQGPHLHFEIFETKTDKRLNPLLFNFPLPDNVPPTIVKLGLYDRDISTYEQTPRLFNLKNTDSGYIIPKLDILKTGLNKLSFSIQAYDRLTGTQNQDGIYAATLYIDDEPIVGFVIDSLSYPSSDYINAHIDYRYRYNGGSHLQHLSQLPGEKSGLYRQYNGDGVINLNDTIVHFVRIVVMDAALNTSELYFQLQYSDSLAQLVKKETIPQQLAPNKPHQFKREGFEIDMPNDCLYDSIRSFYYRYNSAATYAVSPIHQFNDPSFPAHSMMNVRIKPDRQFPGEWRDKLIMQRVYRGQSNIRKAVWENDWLVGRFNDFGNFQVFADVVAPSINELGSSKTDTIDLSPASRILFTPTDNFGIKSFRAELNGEWLRFTNDKGRNWIYVFDERCPYGVYHLKVTVEDLVGNSTTKEWWFKRGPYTPPKKKAVKKRSKKKPVVRKKK
jgi:murein DD-endopeptidase MepM/ murein hydrolase activator NlpD